MEIGDGVAQKRGVELVEGFLEAPEGLSGVLHYHGVLGGAVGHGIDVSVHSPECGAFIVIVLAVGGVYVAQALDVRMVLGHELGNQLDVVHDIPGLAEHVGVDLLDDVGMHPAVDQEVRAAGVVDLAYIDLAHVHETRKVELVRYSFYFIKE